MLAFTLLLGGIAGADNHLSSDPRVQEARKLTKDGKNLQALEILQPLRNVHADHMDVLFLIGLVSLRAALQIEEGDAQREELLDEAIAAFHEILVDQPELVRVRLELARAFFHKEEDGLARKHFELVKAGDQPQAMIANIDRFLQQIKARRGWNAQFGMSIAPNNNIGNNSANRVIYISGLPFVLDEENPVSTGVGLSFWGAVDYQMPLNSSTFLRSRFELSRTEYKGHDFDSTRAGVKVGPHWLIGAGTTANLQASLSQSWAGNRRDNVEKGVSADITRNFSPRLRGTARLALSKRNYNHAPSNNGPLRSLSLSAIYLLSPIVQTNVQVGYSDQRPKTYRQRHSYYTTALGVDFALPRGYSVGVSGQLNWIDYRGNWTPFVLDGSPRKDRTRNIRLTVSNRSLTWHGFSPQLALINESRKSNAQLYDYRSNSAELSFVRQF